MIIITHRFSDTTLCEFDVKTVCQAAELGKANLQGANLYEANLQGADLSEASLRGANLYGANLSEANLYGANLQGANLRGANLYEADLREANLSEASLVGADLRGANLRGANLRGADLRGVNLYGANLREANIDGEVVSISPIQIPCGLRYVALITDNYMRLGCKRYSHDEWANFTDEEIAVMDKDALEFWKQWKSPLLAMCKAHREGVNKNDD